MQQRISDTLLEDMRSKTVLDHVRPTVVVRRRIYDPAQFHETSGGGAAAVAEPEPEAPVASFVGPTVVEAPQIFERTHSFLPTQSWGATDEDESGPPSSVNVARALASLRSDELQRLDELIRRDDDDDDDDGPTSSVVAPPMSMSPASMGPASMMPASMGPISMGPLSIAPPSRAPLSTAHVQPPTVRLPQQIALTDLAQRMGIPTDELVTALITHGFFTVAQSSVLGRDTARVAADMFGWQSADMSEDEDAAHAAQYAPKKRGSSTPTTKPKKKAPTKRK